MSMARLDKWLWAARFFKTRTLAAESIAGGHISVNGERAKPSKALKPGDIVEVRKPPFAHTVVVKALGERRGPAAEAQQLYEETAQSVEQRARLAAQMRSQPAPRFKGRPTKKDRRDYERWLRGDDE